MKTQCRQSTQSYRPASYARLRGNPDDSLFDCRFNCFERCQDILKQVYSTNLRGSHEFLFKKIEEVYIDRLMSTLSGRNNDRIPLMTLFTGLLL